MQNFLSYRAKTVKTSPTILVFSKAKKLMAQGHDVINFGVGEPDFNTPDNIKESAKQAIDDNFTKYTVVAGIPELRKAICQKFKRDNNLDYSAENILVSPGAKSSIMHVLMTICNAGDEIIIPTPYWVSYTSQVELVDGIPVLLSADETTSFKISADQLEKKILTLSKPKAIILNSPNNPTGAVYSKDELREIGNVCLKHNIIIIADEIYEKLVYEDIKHCSIAEVSEEIKNITVVINGVSKAHAMTGWRLGYAAGPMEIIKSATKIQGHTTSCVNSITQKACITALIHEDGSLVKMNKEFLRRRNFMLNSLLDIEGIKCPKPDGAFYVFPNVAEYLSKNEQVKTTMDLCLYLLEKYHIAVVPGNSFGAENYIRFSYANSMQNLEKGIKRFKAGLSNL